MSPRRGLLAVLLTCTFAAGPASRPVLRPVPPTTDPSAVPTSDYRNDEHHFQFQYPTQWKLLDRPVNNQVVSMQVALGDANAPAEGVAGMRIVVDVEAGSDPEILKEISGEMVNYVFNNGGKKVVVKDDRLGDLRARRIRFEIDKAGAKSHVLYVVAVRHRKEYVFTAAAPGDGLDRMLPGIEALLKSFELSE